MVSATRFGRRTLDDGGPLVLWDERDRGAQRRGLALQTSACDDPQCPMVTLAGHPVDDRSESIVITRGEEKLSARFNVGSGRLTADTTVSDDEGTEPFLGLVRDQLGGALATILRRRWRQAKGLEDRTSWRSRDWSWWEPGDVVAHSEVFPDRRDFVVTHAGKSYWADDRYCVNPACECREVLLVFHDVSSEETASLGTVRVEHESWRPVQVDSGTASAAKLR